MGIHIAIRNPKKGYLTLTSANKNSEQIRYTNNVSFENPNRIQVISGSSANSSQNERIEVCFLVRPNRKGYNDKHE